MINITAIGMLEDDRWYGFVYFYEPKEIELYGTYKVSRYRDSIEDVKYKKREVVKYRSWKTLWLKEYERTEYTKERYSYQVDIAEVDGVKYVTKSYKGEND